MYVQDFVRKYMHLLSRITDAPIEFIEASALFLLSSAVGLKYLFRSLPETTIFGNMTDIAGKLLNLWFILIGKSRIARKTSAIRHVKDLSKKVFGTQRILSEAFTPEALVKEMSEKARPSVTGGYETVCSWINDEIAGFFQLLKKRDSYMTSADDFLSKTYDGTTHDRDTIGRGKETVWKPYLTCLLASTDYLPALFDELQIRLGFMNRFIYVIGERKERKPLRTKPLTEDEKKEAKEVEDFLRALDEKRSVTVLEMTNEAKQIYDAFEEEIEKQIANGSLGIKEGYCGQLPNLAVRLSCLYRISRMTPEEIRSYSNPILTVEKQDVERAIDYIWKAWEWFERVIEMMNAPKTKDTAYGTLTRIGRQKVFEMLKEGSKKREDFIEPLRKLGITPTLLDNAILPSLIKDNLIQKLPHRFGWYSLVQNNAGNNQQHGSEDVGKLEK